MVTLSNLFPVAISSLESTQQVPCNVSLDLGFARKATQTSTINAPLNRHMGAAAAAGELLGPFKRLCTTRYVNVELGELMAALPNLRHRINMMKISTNILFAATAVSLLATACTNNTPEQQVRSAMAYLQKNDSKSATIELKNALQNNPNLAEARFVLGMILLEDGNITAAEIEFRKALAANHPKSIVVPELARAMLTSGQAKKLVDEFGSIKFEKPLADASFQTVLVTAYDILGKPEKAKAALNAALNADPNYAPALIERARQLAAGRDFDDALLAIDGVIQKNPGKSDAWKLKGDILFYEKNKTEEALLTYRKSIEANPKFMPGHIAILTILMKQGKLAEAASQLQQLKSFAANSPQTMYLEARLAYQNKDYKLARDVTQKILKSAPNSSRFLQLAGEIEFQMDSLVQAENYLSRAIQAAPELQLARRFLIMTYLRSGQSDKALATLKAGTGRDGLDPGMFSLAGEVYLHSGDAKKAEQYFASALKLDPKNVGKRTALAIAHLATGQTAIALDELREVARSDSGTVADLALINAHLNRKEFDKALVAIDRLGAKQPGKPLAANLRGRLQLAQNDKTAARKSFEQALTIDSSNFEAAANLAVLDMADKKPTEAKKRFENFLAKNPKDGRALMSLAQLAILSGAEKNEVTGLMLKAVEANPQEVAPRLQLIDLYLKSKDTKQALTAAQDSVSRLPNSPEILGALGRVQQLSGDVNQAIATYTKLIALQPFSPQPHIRLAEAHAANKNIGAAEQSLRKALEIQPDILDAQRALIILSLETKRYQDAGKVARTIQEQRPSDMLGFQLEGDIAVAQNNWEAAALAYQAGLQRGPSAELATKLHTTLIYSGKYPESDKFATTWLKEHPDDSKFLFHLGDFGIIRKDYAAAQKYYLSILRFQPDNAIALNNLAWAMSHLHKDGAIVYAEKANRLAPNQPEFMDTLAMLLAENNEYAKAIDLLNRALKIQPSNFNLRLNLAKIYINAGEKIQAKTELVMLSQLGEKFAAQSEVAALLKGL